MKYLLALPLPLMLVCYLSYQEMQEREANIAKLEESLSSLRFLANRIKNDSETKKLVRELEMDLIRQRLCSDSPTPKLCVLQLELEAQTQTK